VHIHESLLHFTRQNVNSRNLKGPCPEIQVSGQKASAFHITVSEYIIQEGLYLLIFFLIRLRITKSWKKTMIELKFIDAQDSNSVHGNWGDCFYIPNFYLLSQKNTYTCTLFFSNKHQWRKMCLARHCLDRRERKEQRDCLCILELDMLLGMNIQII
jgi:hypothetical protein